MAKIKKADNEELVIARKEHALKKEEKGKKALLKDATMNNRIKILHLEDSLKDSELIRSLIESGGIEHDYFFVDNEKDFINFLETEKVDIILCDYNLPGYKGDEALKFAKEKFSHIPFILVSGTIGQGAVSNTLINGATDYVRKSNLDRLVPVIKRALHERETEINKISAEIKLNLKNVQIEAQKEKYEQIKDELSIQKA
jgi:CheY-like chemotaxis protein